MARYAERGIATYSEIILGLPGETYDSFADGLATLLDAGQHDSVNVYPCIMLKNSEMSDPAYVEQHGLKSVRSPMPMFHAVPSIDPHPEQYDLVVETKTMPPDDWMKAQMFSWAVQTFHCMGLTSSLAIVMKSLGIGYRRFYEEILQIRTGLIGAEIEKTRKIYEDLRAGRNWEQVLPGCGKISWSPEEASFLRLSSDEAFKAEILEYAVRWVFGADADVVSSAVKYQAAVAPGPHQPHCLYFSLDCDIHALVEGVRRMDGGKWSRDRVTYDLCREPYYSGALERFAKEVVWYGRKGGSSGVKVKRV
jgi:putative methyltransferase